MARPMISSWVFFPLAGPLAGPLPPFLSKAPSVQAALRNISTNVRFSAPLGRNRTFLHTELNFFLYRNWNSTWLFLARPFVWFEGRCGNAVPSVSAHRAVLLLARTVAQFADKSPCTVRDAIPVAGRREGAAGFSRHPARSAAKDRALSLLR